MPASNVVIVESPSKAKTINKYLGSDYKVLASMGHVRDLPSKNGSVDPDKDYAMVWEESSQSKKHMAEIKKALKTADTLYLATDPDREGEAISWHIHDMFAEKGLLKSKNVRRVTFNEITKTAVQKAFEKARDVDQSLVDAYLARRALDYLVGFNLSPILWRKLPGSRSAGRVQSVALRLICEREREIEKFDPQEYWSIEADFKTPKGKNFKGRLTHLDSQKLKKFDIGNEAAAQTALSKIKGQEYTIAKIEKKQVKRNPAAPFITSTLQQEAARKLGFGASRTMRTAQRLYEGANIGGETVGLITYMRTDGVTLSGQAIASARQVIEDIYGKKYVPDSPRQYKSKAKNAQEAHEAIRPTDLSRKPEDVAKYLEADQLKLYTLIWKRTIACQMATALLDQVAVDMISDDQQITFRANGSIVAFDGFFKVYMEGRDDTDDEKDDDNNDKILPPMNEGDKPDLKTVTPNQHFTQPPPRFTEASLVKKLEELGIGRPSTYASILSVLQARNYVRLEQKRFFPEDRGRVVTAFLENFFAQYVEYDFTANLEEELDTISDGKLDWRKMLDNFWKPFIAKIDETKELRIQDVIKVLNKELEDMLYPPREDGTDRRACPSCDDGRLSLKLGRFGGFIGCSNHPDCKYTRPLVVDAEQEEEAMQAAKGPRELGKDPETGRMISARPGPYGPYVQKDLTAEEEALKGKKKPKPKRAGLPKHMTLDSVTLEEAIELLRLPRDLGRHPETDHKITAGLGRFGPFVKYDKIYASIPKDEDVLTIELPRALELIKEKQEKIASGVGRYGKKKTTTKKKKATTKKKKTPNKKK